MYALAYNIYIHNPLQHEPYITQHVHAHTPNSALGGVGVAISAQYSVSKLYNDPLLRTSISLVASSEGEKGEKDNGDSLSKSVSTALLLAGVVGLIQVCSTPIHTTSFPTT